MHVSVTNEKLMMKKNLPIGIHGFAELIEGNYYVVDKSLLIKELIDSAAKVTLLPRPRRFGKTVNMSMLQCFFEQTKTSNRHLFNGLKIEQHSDYMAKQGQYPVIALTFKDIKQRSWTDCFDKLKRTIIEELDRHYPAIEPHLNARELADVKNILSSEANVIAYESALKDLSAYLNRAYKKRPLILIDEYDAPIHTAVEHGYYDDIVNFMRGFLSGGLKDNSNLELCVLTGILRIAKESIFSGLNNLEVSTILQEQYADKFGLLEDEVVAMFEYYEKSERLAEARAWYDGYQSGPYKIYNPWSIINFAKTGNTQSFWANTSGNALLKQIVQESEPRAKEDFELLMRGIAVTKEIDENVVMTDLSTNERAGWAILLMSGYLTFENYRQEGRKWFADLKIPNEEIYEIYDTQILAWFEKGTISTQYQSMLRYLTSGETENFSRLFSQFALETLSVFDATGKYPEKFYHGLVLGMLASLRDTHEVISNRESGWGRYDVSIFPKEVSKPGIIIEFKAIGKIKKETLLAAAQAALKQIDERQYETAMRARGITTVIKIGIAFNGKKTVVLF